MRGAGGHDVSLRHDDTYDRTYVDPRRMMRQGLARCDDAGLQQVSSCWLDLTNVSLPGMDIDALAGTTQVDEQMDLKMKTMLHIPSFRCLVVSGAASLSLSDSGLRFEPVEVPAFLSVATTFLTFFVREAQAGSICAVSPCIHKHI